MSLDSLLTTGMAGIQRGNLGMQQAAQDIAQANIPQESKSDQTDLVESLVDLQSNGHLVKASFAVVKVAEDLMGTLLDTKA
jgi:hypothetical protein|tara:strand:+ start:3665 stop:3907 length:243 start_codon:yes stop_codon:yes gene_type:complete